MVLLFTFSRRLLCFPPLFPSSRMVETFLLPCLFCLFSPLQPLPLPLLHYYTTTLLHYYTTTTTTVAAMYPAQLGKPQPLHPPSSAENDKHSEEHIYEQLDPTCTSLDSLPLVETDPEEIGQLWDEVQASQMVIPGKAIAPHVAMAPTTDDLYAHCLDSRGIRVDDDDKNVFVYKFFGTLRTTPPLLCQDCPWIAPACVLRFTRQLPYSYSRMSFVDLIHSTVLLRSPLGHSFSDGKGYKWHAERCLGDVDGGNFGSDWKTAPDLSKQGGLTAPPKRPGSLTSRSNVSHGRAAVPPVAGPGLALFCQSPHVSYWLRMPEGLSPGLLKPTFSIQNRLVLPYLSVLYWQPGRGRQQRLVQSLPRCRPDRPERAEALRPHRHLGKPRQLSAVADGSGPAPRRRPDGRACGCVEMERSRDVHAAPRPMERRSGCVAARRLAQRDP